MKMEPLVSAGWLARHLNDASLRVFDATVQVSRLLFLPMVRSGRRDWRRGHIPGSAFADLFSLGDPQASRHSFTLPSTEHFAAAVGKVGIGSDHRVILYDRRENMWASRLWWMLRCFGRSLPELREKLGGILDAERVVTYCGAGAAAASLANVLVRLGHPNVAIYEGGLYDWCRDRSLPLEVGG